MQCTEAAAAVCVRFALMGVWYRHTYRYVIPDRLTLNAPAKPLPKFAIPLHARCNLPNFVGSVPLGRFGAIEQAIIVIVIITK